MVDEQKSIELLYQRMRPMVELQPRFDIVNSKFGLIAAIFDGVNRKTGERNVLTYLLDNIDDLLGELFTSVEAAMITCFDTPDAVCKMPEFMCALVYHFIKGLPDEEYAIFFLGQYLKDRIGEEEN